MTDGKALKDKIKKAGISISFLAIKMNCSRNRIYSIIGGADCNASEIISLSEHLHLTKTERDDIFLSEKVN